MGSVLQVASCPSEGSTFWFELTSPVVVGGDAAQQPACCMPTGYHGPRRQVLVVDDNVYNRAFLTDLLAILGFTVAEAVDGQDAIARAFALRPDLILMDLQMGDVDGLAAIREIRQHEALNSSVIFATSASVFASDQEHSLLAGCAAFVPKPIQVPSLLELLAFHLGLKWYYANDDAGTDPSPAPDALAPLVSPAELVELYELALIGDVLGLQYEAERLAGAIRRPRLLHASYGTWRKASRPSRRRH